MEHREAKQGRSAADTTVANDVPYEAATKEKTPGPGGGTRRRWPNPRPSIQMEEQEVARPADRPRSGESVACQIIMQYNNGCGVTVQKKVL
ncbi:hypothetical protein NDU88_007190 [Pleurodeles waltl]|uniref:Uncharacterized protein n=1 Tax=Pleurodeles waltl TaxID=8319 RepID=A0AAV7QNA0_PLEWA|nr:hypothetical protein NDU88_007190 [Pleurodeles waltl]